MTRTAANGPSVGTGLGSFSPLAAKIPGETEVCQCFQCLTERDERIELGNFSLPITATRMVVCATCGNKRCPHSTDHRHACTGSNEPGQQGSRYA